MFTKAPSTPSPGSRKQTAEAVGQALARLPMILDVLKRLNHEAVPLPGDEEIRRGCDRAVTAILAKLARIGPAADGRAGKTEMIALGKLDDPEIGNLLDADQLQRLREFTDRILGGAGSVG
jgi:hypothetical protein